MDNMIVTLTAPENMILLIWVSAPEFFCPNSLYWCLFGQRSLVSPDLKSFQNYFWATDSFGSTFGPLKQRMFYSLNVFLVRVDCQYYLYAAESAGVANRCVSVNNGGNPWALAIYHDLTWEQCRRKVSITTIH